MLVETEHVTAIDTDALENAVAVKQAVIEDLDLRIVGVHVFAIKVNDHGGRI